MVVWIGSLHFIYLLTIEDLVYPIIIIVLIGVKIYIKTFNAAKNFHNLKENEVKRRSQELFVSQLLPIHVKILIFNFFFLKNKKNFSNKKKKKKKIKNKKKKINKYFL